MDMKEARALQEKLVLAITLLQAGGLREKDFVDAVECSFKLVIYLMEQQLDDEEETFVCTRCGKEAPQGFATDLPDHCDDCWAKVHGKAPEGYSTDTDLDLVLPEVYMQVIGRPMQPIKELSDLSLQKREEMWRAFVHRVRKSSITSCDGCDSTSEDPGKDGWSCLCRNCARGKLEEV